MSTPQHELTKEYIMRKRTIAVIAAGSLFVIGAVASAGDETVKTPATETPAVQVPAASTPPAAPKWNAKADVVVNSCEAGDFGYPRADLTITNSSDKARTYMVTVVFDGADGTRLAEGIASVSDLTPGQKSKEDVMGLSKADGKFTCKVTEVSTW